MTRPIPEGAARKRQARSCIECRAVKIKCIGAVTEQKDGNETALKKCERCDRIKSGCHFATSRRKGRPRRLPKGDAAVKKVESVKLEDDSDGEWVGNMQAAGALHKSSPANSEATTADGSVDLSQYHLHVGVKPDVPTHDYKTLAHYLLQDVHPYLPLLPDQHNQLEHHLRSSPSILAEAVSTMVYPHSLIAADVTTRLGNTLFDVQASLFLAYGYLGRNEPDQARKLLEWSGHQILAHRWHQLDDPAAPPRDPVERDMIRRAFYESWGAEITLSMISGIPCQVLSTVPFTVKEPGTEQLALGMVPLSQDSAFILKVRALYLVAQGSAPPSSSSPTLSEFGLICIALGKQARLAFTNAKNRVDREQAFIAVMLTCAALIHLQSTSYASSAFTCGLDTTMRPSRAARSLTLCSSELIFTTLHDSLVANSPVMMHSPFFSCALLVAANGALSTLRAKLLYSYQDDDFVSDVISDGAPNGIQYASLQGTMFDDGGLSNGGDGTVHHYVPPPSDGYLTPSLSDGSISHPQHLIQPYPHSNGYTSPYLGGYPSSSSSSTSNGHGHVIGLGSPDSSLDDPEYDLQYASRALALSRHLDLVEAFLLDHSTRWVNTAHILDELRQLRSVFVDRMAGCDLESVLISAT